LVSDRLDLLIGVSAVSDGVPHGKNGTNLRRSNRGPWEKPDGRFIEALESHRGLGVSMILEACPWAVFVSLPKANNHISNRAQQIAGYAHYGGIEANKVWS